VFGFCFASPLLGEDGYFLGGWTLYDSALLVVFCCFLVVIDIPCTAGKHCSVVNIPKKFAKFEPSR